MAFVLVVILVAAAGWIYMSATDDRNRESPNPNSGNDDSVPGNVYDNPYDTNENNDRPFEPDADGDAPGECPTDDTSGGGGD